MRLPNWDDSSSYVVILNGEAAVRDHRTVRLLMLWIGIPRVHAAYWWAAVPWGVPLYRMLDLAYRALTGRRELSPHESAMVQRTFVSS